jgi:hypothetical protein
MNLERKEQAGEPPSALAQACLMPHRPLPGQAEVIIQLLLFCMLT